MIPWKKTIAQRFDAAAETYDTCAISQRQIALALRQRILQESLPSQVRVLEIGCGTGFLTQTLLPDLPDCQWLATDISPRMVDRCVRSSGGRVLGRVMDGEFPDLKEASFDLVVSSMAIQWFQDLGAGVERLHGLLRPGGLLAVNALGSGTFREWRQVCREAGADPGPPPYPSSSLLADRLGIVVSKEDWPLVCPDLHGFLSHLKAIGARTAAPGQRPLPTPLLRRLLRDCQDRPFTTRYEVLTILWRKET